MKLKVFILDDDATFAQEISRFLQRHGYLVQTAGLLSEARNVLSGFYPDIALLDLQLPDGQGTDMITEIREKLPFCLILMVSGHGSISAAVDAVKMGAENFLTKPIHPEQLLITLERLAEMLTLRQHSTVEEMQLTEKISMVTGSSLVMRQLLQTSQSAATSDSTVLITGETGTGKHLLALYIHQNSPRHDFPFVYVNCASLSETLLESDLFGHERGAFTGAHIQKKGRVELAHRGTLFLDEIAEIPPAIQAKLLHFIEYGEFQRVGGTQTLQSTCRIICATNRDLAARVKEKRFREDLFYRINVIQLHIPPLRERPEDIPALLKHFLERFSRDLGRPTPCLADSLLEKLNAYPWPGNIRELKNAVERALVLNRAEVLTENDFPIFKETAPGEADDLLAPGPLKDALKRFKKKYIHTILARCGGNQSQAAKVLQIQRTYLNRLLNEEESDGTRPDQTEI
jgi:DNA-binding NtrC family response regulator